MGTLNVNGKSFSGDNIRIRNGKVEVDGEQIGLNFTSHTVKIEVHGNVSNLETDLLTVINGNVGNLYCKGSVKCEKVEGDIISRGSIAIGGEEKG